jgi:Clp amino terminal domain, pathogenicity island component
VSDAPETAVEYHPWTTYIAGREEARRRGDRRVGTDYLVLGLLRDHEMEQVIGVTLVEARDALERLDHAALSFIGVTGPFNPPYLAERPAPKRPKVKELLTDRLKLTPAAKAVLQEAGSPMRRGKHISANDVLLALLENTVPDPAATLFEALGVNTAALRARIVTTHVD